MSINKLNTKSNEVTKMRNVDFYSIIRKESAKTVAALSHILTEADARLKNIEFRCMADGVKERLTRKFAVMGVEFSVSGLCSMPADYQRFITERHAEFQEQAEYAARERAWTYCAEHYVEIQYFLMRGAKLHFQFWTGSSSHKRLAYNSEKTLMDNIVKADPTVQYAIRNDAPRGGAEGEHYLFTGDRAWANRFLARLSAKLAPSV